MGKAGRETEPSLVREESAIPPVQTSSSEPLSPLRPCLGTVPSGSTSSPHAKGRGSTLPPEPSAGAPIPRPRCPRKLLQARRQRGACSTLTPGTLQDWVQLPGGTPRTPKPSARLRDWCYGDAAPPPSTSPVLRSAAKCNKRPTAGIPLQPSAFTPARSLPAGPGQLCQAGTNPVSIPRWVGWGQMTPSCRHPKDGACGWVKVEHVPLESWGEGEGE